MIISPNPSVHACSWHGSRPCCVASRPMPMPRPPSSMMTPTEFHILHFLARRPGWVFTRYQIVDAVRGEDAEVTERSVDVHVAAIRRKLGNYRELIETLRGVGYRFRAS